MSPRFPIAFVALALGLAGQALAQPPPPTGPAQVITRAREAQEARRREEATSLPPDAAEAVEGGAAAGAGEEAGGAAAGGAGGADPAARAEAAAMQAHASRALAEPQLAAAEPSPEVPVGEIRVAVLDVDGQPARGAMVRLGIMGSAGDRESKTARTDDDGETRFSDLPTGTAQAYRVSVLHEGASYGSTPFRLEPDRGHLVRVLRIPVTRSDEAVIQWIGGSFLEIKPDRRVHVVQQVELVNLGRETYVMPEGGLQVPLPAGFTAFQSQQVMSDQRFVPNETGFRLEGSLPPGRVQLTWAFDLPVDGDELTFSQRIPFETHQYVVVTEYTRGLELEVDGFPSAQRGEDRGREHLATRLVRTPNEAPWRELEVTLRGIPGPGPERTLAVLLAFGFVGLAAYLARPGAAAVREEAAALRQVRREELLEEARELEAAFAREEVGPKFHERRRREIVDELAILLGMDRQDALSAEGAPGGATKRRATPRGR